HAAPWDGPTVLPRSPPTRSDIRAVLLGGPIVLSTLTVRPHAIAPGPRTGTFAPLASRKTDLVETGRPSFPEVPHSPSPPPYPRCTIRPLLPPVPVPAQSRARKSARC